ncbi:protein-tyrosine phosphatase family protein [Apilactobacillus timberlakei]|uniref:Uncharacterized protein n=1 Tax=Apilactobacillus timberlakei TaxID=2008380 RepID=A0ABY2YVM8_9LACO|nr:hypothetical protein [Apilactobacillus timberlakei]TPR12773.1 hypothetical protein DY048_07115 [Apilactobacillus timberlakei]TPR13656.1 hypothetical protein DY052_07985 [Apilactobacillus timberlakei]
MNEQEKINKQNYLKKFPEPMEPTLFKDEQQIKASGEKLVKLLKKEGLTYEDAYASLQYAYNQIKYESNFLKLN